MLSRLFRRSPELMPSKAAYARWARNYPPMPHNRFMEIEQSVMLGMLPDLKGKRVLDLACGTGRWGKIAQEHGAKQIISLDESPDMLHRGKIANPLEATMTETPLKSNSIDVVICGLAVGHVVTPRMWSVLSEIKRILVVGGVAFISDVHPVQMWRGGQRTFEDGRKTIAIEHYVHSYADYHAASQRIGLTISQVKEESARDGEPPVLLALGFTRSV